MKYYLMFMFCILLSSGYYKDLKKVTHSGVTYNFVYDERIDGIKYNKTTLQLLSKLLEDRFVCYNDSDTLLFDLWFGDSIVPKNLTFLSSCDTLYFLSEYNKKLSLVLDARKWNAFDKKVYSSIRNNDIITFSSLYAEYGGVSRTGPLDQILRLELQNGRIINASCWLFEIVSME